MVLGELFNCNSVEREYPYIVGVFFLRRHSLWRSVPLTVKDPDHEDASKETDAIKRMFLKSCFIHTVLNL